MSQVFNIEDKNIVDYGASLNRKVLWRVLYPLLFLEVLNFLDRVNVSFAALQMNKALSLSPHQYGLGITLFSITYVAFQLPSIWALKRYGLRLWLTVLTAAWGLVTLATAAIHTPLQFYVLRTVLGISESGFAAGAIYYVTLFSTRRFRAAAIALTMVAVPISVIIGGPLSGWLMSFPPAALPGWRWMFLIEGLPALIFSIVTPFWFADGPDVAPWLAPGERIWLAATLAREAAQGSVGAVSSDSAVFKSVNVWIAGAIYFCIINASTVIVFWLPQVVKPMVGKSDFLVGVVSALPWIGTALGMVIGSRHSDKTQERTFHVAIPALIAALGLGLATFTPAPLVGLALLVVGSAGLGAAQGTFWSLPSQFLNAPAMATGVAFIAFLAAILMPIFPVFIGWLKETTGSFQTPIIILSVSLLVASGLVVLLAKRTSQQKA